MGRLEKRHTGAAAQYHSRLHTAPTIGSGTLVHDMQKVVRRGKKIFKSWGQQKSLMMAQNF